MEKQSSTGLERRLGLLGLAATGICSMLGAAINIIPFMLHRNVPGIGPYVLPAYLFAAVPVILAALAYATLSSAMPRAGGSYVYASRGLSPYLGFVASFSQWFGLSVAIGVVSYVTPLFIRDAVALVGMDGLVATLDQGPMRVGLALAFLWMSVGINMRGVRNVERVLVPLMFVMFILGGLVIVAGFLFDQTDFAEGLMANEGALVPDIEAEFSWSALLAASAILFSSFIGFDSIAQAGGEAKNPERALPMAIGIGAGFRFCGFVYLQKPIHIVDKPLLISTGRQFPEATMPVQNRQQGNADARFPRCGERSQRHLRHVHEGHTAGIVVQVLEFADRCEARFQHFDIKLRRNGFEIGRIDSADKTVHQFAPGPETIFRSTCAVFA